MTFSNTPKAAADHRFSGPRAATSTVAAGAPARPVTVSPARTSLPWLAVAGGLAICTCIAGAVRSLQHAPGDAPRPDAKSDDWTRVPGP